MVQSNFSVAAKGTARFPIQQVEAKSPKKDLLKGSELEDDKIRIDLPFQFNNLQASQSTIQNSQLRESQP